MGKRAEENGSSSNHKRKTRPKKIEFVGWGSKPLIDFLESIGKDKNTKLSQFDVSVIINEYVRNLKLLDPEKKKKVVCDERLYSLFRKKSVPRNRIYDMLEEHFADNQDSSEDLSDGSKEQEEHGNLTCVRSKVTGTEKKAPCKKTEQLETPKSCYAAVTYENIKFLYLKRTLVEDLLRNPESFEGKLMGSYIRIKCDPNDFFQKNAYQLHPVTGVKHVPKSDDVGKEVLLKVPNVINDISISMLSDVNFTKEECEDLSQRVKDGLLQRPTVVEFERKAKMLHEDITKHWIPRELVLIKNLIDRANEKGWRRESLTLHELLQRRQLLETPSEQSRLLLELPKVIADELEPESTLQEQDPKQDPKPLDGFPPTTVKDSLNINVDAGTGAKQSLSSSHCLHVAEVAVQAQVAVTNSCFGEEGSGSPNKEDEPMDLIEEKRESERKPTKNESTSGLPSSCSPQAMNTLEIEANASEHATSYQTTGSDKVGEVIELSSDDDDEIYNATRPQWYYIDPNGQVRGPFPLQRLSRWKDAGFFQSDFRIWKEGQNLEEAVLLTDMLSALK